VRDLGRDPGYVEMLDAAMATVERAAGAADEAFGLAHALADTDDPRAGELAAYAFLEAQGYHVTSSSALARLALAPLFRDGIDLDAGWGEEDAGGFLRSPGWATGATIAVDRPGEGLVLVGDASPAQRDHAIDDDYLRPLRPGATAAALGVPEAVLAPYRSGILARTRLGAAAEILGACTRMIDDALVHVHAREQFGSRLADLPAVQDIIAWAAAERHQLVMLLDLALTSPSPDTGPEELATVTKALAGRVARRIAQGTLQATGGIGFTWEYGHHRAQSRTLALDAWAGSSGALCEQLGRRVRETGELPDLVAL
jgi:hypothetical protein